jgi:cell pole-organizing protein PopZ
MTKPQFSAEPSMEDILASIRKMISEERIGPRPIPDQIGRSPFGESLSDAPAADMANGPSLAKSDETPADRSTPSFSSLSDALKAATPSPSSEPEAGLTLEEKIADMLEGEDAPARPIAPSRPAAAPDPLAVFAANRPGPAPSPDTVGFGGVPRGAPSERPSAEPRMPDASSDRLAAARATPERPSARHSAGSSEQRAAELPRGPKPTPQPPEAPLNGAARGRGESTARPAGSAKAADTQRVIAMPGRNGAAPAQQPGVASAAPGLNGHGSNVSSLGLRPFPGNAPGQRPGPGLRDADTPDDKAATAKSSDGPKPKSGENAERTKLTDAVAGVAALVEQELKAERAEAPREQEAKTGAAAVKVPSPTVAPAPATARAPAEADKSGKARSEETATKAEAQQVAKADKPANSRAPSDALLDAVVDLVHKEPETLSVFTSGNAFVNGISSQASVSKPGPNMARKLDRSAAELLRPMLRQWLSDNMPRIVEEALRSELMSSQSPPEDSEES